MRVNLWLSFLLLVLFSGVVFAQQNLPSGSKKAAAAAIGNKLPVPFTSDGCTMWFDADYRDCCVQHDFEYLSGSGRWRARLRADNHLFLCIAGKSDSWHLFVAPVMWSGVRVFGSDWLPLSNKNVVHKFSRRLIRYYFGNKDRSQPKKPHSHEVL